MQTVSLGDNMHETSKPVFWGKIRNLLSMSSAEFAHRVIMVNSLLHLSKIWTIWFYKKSMCLKTDGYEENSVDLDQIPQNVASDLGTSIHYENTHNQIYCKFHHQKFKVFR